MDPNMLEVLKYGGVGILTVLSVQIGKKALPALFSSDMNVWMAVILGVLWQVVFNATTPPFAVAFWDAVPAGAGVGLAVAGLYRGVSASAKASSVDFNEQAVPPHVIAQSILDAHAEVEGGDTSKTIGFGTK